MTLHTLYIPSTCSITTIYEQLVLAFETSYKEAGNNNNNNNNGITIQRRDRSNYTSIEIFYDNQIFIKFSNIAEDNSNEDDNTNKLFTQLEFEIFDSKSSNDKLLNIYESLYDTIKLIILSCCFNNNSRDKQIAASTLNFSKNMPSSNSSSSTSSTSNNNIICSLLEEQFGEMFKNPASTSDSQQGVITTGKYSVLIDLEQLRVVESDSAPLKGRVESVLAIGKLLRTPLC